MSKETPPQGNKRRDAIPSPEESFPYLEDLNKEIRLPRRKGDYESGSTRPSINSKLEIISKNKDFKKK